jgi:hypothetical protein
MGPNFPLLNIHHHHLSINQSPKSRGSTEKMPSSTPFRRFPPPAFLKKRKRSVFLGLLMLALFFVLLVDMSHAQEEEGDEDSLNAPSAANSPSSPAGNVTTTIGPTNAPSIAVNGMLLAFAFLFYTQLDHPVCGLPINSTFTHTRTRDCHPHHTYHARIH